MPMNFNEFISQLQETNQTLDFFCDFEKISGNVDNIKTKMRELSCEISYGI